MGGFHPTFKPEECIKHCDSVVVGEAEGVIQDLLEDIEKGRLKKIYQAKKLSDLKNLPVPKFNLINKKIISRFSAFPIQATRGCFRGCDFCSINKFFGRTFRKRPVKDVIEEIKASSRKLIFFVDDNLILDREYTKELFKELKKLKIRFFSQVDYTIVYDDELLHLAYRAGAIFLFIGFESVSIESAKEAKKFAKPEDYGAEIKKLRDKGIMVMASIMFGFDNDKKDIFKKTLYFLEKNNVSLASFWIVTPPPDSAFWEKLVIEKRLFKEDYYLHDGGASGAQINFKPKNMDANFLEKKYWKTFRKFYSLKSIFKRIILHPPRNISTFLFLLFLNLYYRSKLIKGVHPQF